MAKKKKKTNFYNFILFLVFISFIIYLIDNWKITQETYIVYDDVLENSIEVESVIIKDEKIVFSNSHGSATFFKDSGERVKSGSLIAQQYSDNNSKNMSDEIKIIDEIINIKQGIKKTNISAGNAYFNEIKIEIQDAILQENYEAALLAINGLNSDEYNDKYYAYENYSVNELISLKESLRKNISSDKISYYSPMGGLITYIFDGLENMYSIDRIQSLNLNDISKLESKMVNTQDKSIQSGEGLFKIIDNFEWYIAAEINKEYYDTIFEDKYVKIRLNRIEKTIYGEIFRAEAYGDRVLIVFKLDKFLHEYLNDRYIKINIITQEFSGLKLTKQSLVKSGELEGVYVCDANKIVKFRPINIIGENEEFVVVDEGEKMNIGSRGRIEINGDTYFTVKTYDSIVMNPENIYDGQILR